LAVVPAVGAAATVVVGFGSGVVFEEVGALWHAVIAVIKSSDSNVEVFFIE
jgi:altronate dehydratase